MVHFKFERGGGQNKIVSRGANAHMIDTHSLKFIHVQYIIEERERERRERERVSYPDIQNAA